MYWYKRFLWIPALVLLLTCVQACKQDAGNGQAKKYFDLKGFFSADSAKLAKGNPLVVKSVIHNKAFETQKLHIANWGEEFSLFSGSDINKPAWRDSYTIQADGDILVYRAKDPKLKTQEIMIRKPGGVIKDILIYNHTKNILYETKEVLSYYPDSVYIIQKIQRVRLLGTDTYKIRGAFTQ